MLWVWQSDWTSGQRLGAAAVGFVLFRLFDIVKPWPANGLQRLPDPIQGELVYLGADICDSLLGPVQPIQGLSEVDDVDAVPFREDESPHLRIPTAGLVSEVDTCLEQFVQFNLLHIGAGFEITAC